MPLPPTSSFFLKGSSKEMINVQVCMHNEVGIINIIIIVVVVMVVIKTVSNRTEAEAVAAIRTMRQEAETTQKNKHFGVGGGLLSVCGEVTLIGTGISIRYIYMCARKTSNWMSYNSYDWWHQRAMPMPVISSLGCQKQFVILTKFAFNIRRRRRPSSSKMKSIFAFTSISSSFPFFYFPPPLKISDMKLKQTALNGIHIS